MSQLKIIHADNLLALSKIPSKSVHLVYIDPPFNTGKKRVHTSISTFRTNDWDEKGRKGFCDHTYTTTTLWVKSYEDTFVDYIAFLKPRIKEIKRILTSDGSIFCHVDSRESHYVKIMLDKIFSRDCFMNELIWSYDFGWRSRTRWAEKHDNIFWYVRDPKQYTFNQDAIDHIPYMAPNLVWAEKAARGKRPTDVWWHTIVPTSGHEKTGYPTQKPLWILKRIIAVHSKPWDTILDCFAGSGTTGHAAVELWRNCILIDSNIDAINTMKSRFHKFTNVEIDSL